MTVAIERETYPLTRDADGTIRVGGTSVPIDAVVYGFLRGESPDEIRDGFPAITLADVYAAIAFYLRHREEVDRYLAEREAHVDHQREAFSAEFPPSVPSRDELLTRWQHLHGAPFPNKSRA